ncbi:MAG: 23S rRNA (pseudouridine(1915)-N(3))-methyltransferase RlmH [Pseudomonadota bacterium]
MQLVVAAIGRAKNSAFAPLIEDYSKRVNRSGPSIGVKSLTIVEAEAPHRLSGAKRRLAEAELLRRNAGLDDTLGSKKTTEKAFLITLDERGKSFSSIAFAHLLQHHVDGGTQRLAFLIGGADGLDSSLRNQSNITLTLGQMTWPHLMVRAMLIEQIYRATMILSGHPYHRE